MFNKKLLSLCRNNVFSFYKKSYSSMASLNLVTNEGVINRLNGNVNIKLNWQLGRVWVNPQHSVHHNSLQPSSSGMSTKSDSEVTTVCSKMDFERFMRKMGLIISREKTVYVQDGVYNSRNIRVISSSQSDAELASSIFTGSVAENAVPDVHILFLTQHPEIGRNRKFLFWDDKRKIILSNSENLNSIKEKLELK